MSSDVRFERGVASLGERVLVRVEAFGDFLLLAFEVFRTGMRRGPGWGELLIQFEATAVRSLPIVAVTTFFTGMVLALQTAFGLARFGAKPYVGSIVGLAIVRELGPVLAAIMVGARVGAGISSELGSMAVTEQVDAIRAMGADPVEKLVVPRVLACVLALPLLTIFADFLGVFGGMIIAQVQYSIPAQFYLTTVVTTIEYADFVSGVAKTFVFGWIVGMVGCFVGLRTTGGTQGVGRSTTRAVVVASIAIFVSDFFLTRALLMLPTDRLMQTLRQLLP
jgi:phospholipid/cholesterol/gamma-HCH transport system permease protein